MTLFFDTATPADKNNITSVTNFSFSELFYLVQNESWVRKQSSGLIKTKENSKRV